jgi:phage gpG-like protein
MAYKLKVTLSDLAERLNRKIDYTAAIEHLGLKTLAWARRRFEDGKGPDGRPWAPLKHPRVSGGNLPLLDRGMLRSSVTTASATGSIFEKTSNHLLAGTALEYGPIHQYGGVIRPKNAKMLAIPATKKAKAVGSPRNWPEGTLHFRWGKRGGVAFTKKGLREQVQYYFAKEVTIPARPYVGYSESDEAEMVEIVAEHAAKEIRKNLGAS